MFDYTTTDPDTELAKLDEGFSRLLTRSRDLGKALEANHAARQAAIDGGPDAPRQALDVRRPPVIETPQRAAAMALLGDLAEFTPAQTGPEAAGGSLLDRLAELSQEEDAIKAAMAMLREPLRSARRRAASAAWRDVAPEFCGAVAVYCDALLALEAAAVPLRRMASHLANIEVPLPCPIPSFDLSPLANRKLAGLLHDAEGAGLLRRTEQPAAA